MDLRKLYKQKLADDVLKSCGNAWYVLICDSVTQNILNKIFKRSDLVDYNIAAVLSLLDERPSWKLAGVYFVNCTKEVGKAITKDYTSGKYSTIEVFSLYEPQGLDKRIKCTVVNVDIVVNEERVFQCSWENLSGLEKLLNVSFQTSYVPCTMHLAGQINQKMQHGSATTAHLLVLDRKMDLLTPLMYFFTFRSILSDFEGLECKDGYFKSVRNLHIGEVGKKLQETVQKLQESVEKLDKENVSIETLGTMVLEAPKHMELREGVEKYSGLLERSFQRLDELKDVVEAQQRLATGRDKDGDRVRIALTNYIEVVGSPYLTKDDKASIVYMMLVKGFRFSPEELLLLESKGLAEEDGKLAFDTRSIETMEPREYKYDISRYEPVIGRIIERFIAQRETFGTFGEVHEKVGSLRKSTMINSEKQPRKIIVVYVANGLSIEETALAYRFSESLGIELLIGGDKIFTRIEAIEEYRSNKNLHLSNIR